jgi:hypothetical protein
VRSYWRRDVDKALSQKGSGGTLGDLQAQRDKQAAEAWQLADDKRVEEMCRHAPCRLACLGSMSMQHGGYGCLTCIGI